MRQLKVVFMILLAIREKMFERCFVDSNNKIYDIEIVVFFRVYFFNTLLNFVISLKIGRIKNCLLFKMQNLKYCFFIELSPLG